MSTDNQAIYWVKKPHKVMLHWRRLRNNAVVVASDSDMKQYWPWPPWVK
jgi:hypothetical protein